MKVYTLTTHEQIEQLAEQFPHRLIIIDFWAPWCGPCMEMKKTFSELATQHQDGIFISVNIDADTTEEIKRVYNIQSIPLFVFIKNHKVIDMMMGANKTESYHPKFGYYEVSQLTMLIECFKMHRKDRSVIA